MTLLAVHLAAPLAPLVARLIHPHLRTLRQIPRRIPTGECLVFLLADHLNPS